MSYTEYENLFYKAQKSGIYHMFIFDIKNSKSYGKNISFIEQVSRLLIINMYNRLEKMQNERSKNILHKGKKIVSINDTHIHNGSLQEPFQFGDMFGLTILRGSIDRDEVYQIFEEEKAKLNIFWDFHMIDGYYETDDYGEGYNKYYRGYCIQQLEDLSKGNKKTK